MKQFCFLLALLVSIQAISQGTDPLPPLTIDDPKMDAYLGSRKIPELTIKVINNATAKKVEVAYVLVCFGASAQTKNTAQLNDNGELKIALAQNLPYQQLWLSVGDYLYAGIYVNTDLTVTIDASKIKEAAYMIADGIDYTGTDGELNKVMNERVLFRQKEHNELTSLLFDISIKKVNNQLKFSKEQEWVFQLRADSIYRKLQEIDEGFLVKYPQYAWAVKNETHSDFYDRICMAYSSSTLPDSLAKLVYAHKPYFTSNGGVYFYRSFSSYVAHLDKNKKSPYDEINKNYTLYSPEQRAALDSVAKYEKMKDAAKQKNEQALNTAYKNRGRLFLKELQVARVENDAQAIDKAISGPAKDILKLSLLENGKDAFSLAYPALLKSTTTAWCKKLIENELTVSLAKQKEIDDLLASSKKIAASDNFIGTPLQSLSFGADLFKLDSINNLDDFIVDLKSKYKNKALIIDFWATWCGPCIADMPSSKKLHEDNKDLPIEYIYLCTNSSSNEELWKKRIIDAKLPGTHIFIDDKIITSLKSKFDAAGGFPTYVVVDINGKSHPKAIQFMGAMDRDKIKEVVGL